MFKKAFLSLVGCFAFANAGAVVIDFSSVTDEVGQGSSGISEFEVPEGTFTALDGATFFFGSAFGYDFCPLASDSFDCEADFQVAFNGLANNLMITLTGFNSGDVVDFLGFDINGDLIGTITAGSNGVVDLSSLGGISTLLVDDRSTGAGFGYTNFTLDLTAVPVPAPGALALFGIGMMCLGMRRRRTV